MAKDFTKSAVEVVRVERRAFKGRDYIDARIYYLGADSPTDYLPSKKGLCLEPVLAAEVARAMAAAAENEET